jgi:hypothetical protein
MWVSPNTYAGSYDVRCTATAEINDVKDVAINGPNSLAVWNSWPVGYVIFDQTQQNRLVIKNCHGAVNFDVTPVFHFQKVKVSATSWRLVFVQ